MKNVCRLILFAALLGAGCPWILQSTHTNIIPGLTDDITLQCFFDGPNRSRPLHGTVTRIRVSKLDKTHAWKTYAKIVSSDASKVIRADPSVPGVTAFGTLGKLEDIFLSLTWSTASHDTIGSYKCEIDGFTAVSDSDVPFITNIVNLTYNGVTIPDLVNVAVSLKAKLHNMSKKLQSQTIQRNSEHQELENEILNQVRNNVDDSLFEVRNWPTESYALLSGAAGCPNTSYSKLDGGYVKIQTETKIKPSHNFSSPSHLVNHVCKNCGTRNVLELRFCTNVRTEPRLTWPKGTYCIHRYASACPSGFTVGYTRFYMKSLISIIDSRQNVGTFIISTNSAQKYFDLYFCCRNDGDADNPILLPNYSDFYLYRYKGKCQAVANTNVTNEWIELDTDDSKKDAYSNTYHADGTINKGRLEMCYYTKNHNHP